VRPGRPRRRGHLRAGHRHRRRRQDRLRAAGARSRGGGGSGRSGRRRGVQAELVGRVVRREQRTADVLCGRRAGRPVVRVVAVLGPVRVVPLMVVVLRTDAHPNTHTVLHAAQVLGLRVAVEGRVLVIVPACRGRRTAGLLL